MSKARSYALRLASKRPYSVAQIKAKLLQKEVQEKDADAIIAELVDHNILNDLRFAKDWLRYRDRFSPRGEFVLVRELIEKGVPEDVIHQALDEREEENEELDEDEMIIALIEKRQSAYAGLDEATRKRRLFAYLARRGFSAERLRRILKI